MTLYEKIIAEDPEFRDMNFSNMAFTCGITKDNRIFHCIDLCCKSRSEGEEHDEICALDPRYCSIEMETILNQEVLL